MPEASDEIKPELDELWSWPALKVVELLATRQVTPTQLLDVIEKRLQGGVDEVVNSVPIRCFERARRCAKELEKEMEQETFWSGHKEKPTGYLYGLPVLIKDLNPVEGVHFTKGCTYLADNIADHSDALVLALEENGAIVCGKTNTPENGAGSQTFNKVNYAACSPTTCHTDTQAYQHLCRTPEVHRSP
jgi:amidase